MTPERYSRAARTLHWLAALLILALLATGFRAADTEAAAGKAALLRLHLPLGIAVLLVTLARLALWWREARAGRRPGVVAGLPAWQRAAGRIVHALLLLVTLGMAASGIGTVALSGAGPAIFGGGALPDFMAYAPRIPHGIGARLLILLVVLHIAAALHHGLIRRDGTLARMGLGRS